MRSRAFLVPTICVQISHEQTQKETDQARLKRGSMGPQSREGLTMVFLRCWHSLCPGRQAISLRATVRPGKGTPESPSRSGSRRGFAAAALG